MRVWYKRVQVHYDSPLPDDGPIIFASTHPNSAIDYFFAPLIHRMPTYVMVRGDVFEKPLLNFLFRTIYMLPVYRFRDGFSSLNRNKDSFRECFNLFDKNGKVLIFSEGICIQKKQLQKIQKGTARLALNYLAKHKGRKIYIVPLATSYTRFRLFRASAMVNYGKAIDAREYIEIYQQNANRAYEKLTADISNSLSKNYVISEDYADQSWAEHALMALRLNRKTPDGNWSSSERTWFDQEKAVYDHYNRFGEASLSEEWKQLAKKVGLNARNEGLLHLSENKYLLLLQWLVLLPIVLASGVTILLPHLFARWLLKNKIKDIIFHNTVSVLGGFVIYFLQIIVLLIIGIAFWGLKGLALPFVFSMFTLIGIELIDDFQLAFYNWKNTSQRKDFERLYLEVEALTVPVSP